MQEKKQKKGSCFQEFELNFNDRNDIMAEKERNKKEKKLQDLNEILILCLEETKSCISFV